MMKMRHHFIAALFLISILTQACNTESANIFKTEDLETNEYINPVKSLRFVSAVFRHGDRTLDIDIGELFPTDSYLEYDDYPAGPGMLTIAGKVRAYKMGEQLRNRYQDFLGDIYYEPNVFACSTSLPRTKMTLQLVLAGLYPPVKSQVWNWELNWQPMNMIYRPSSRDGLLLPIFCSAYKEAYAAMLKEPSVIKKLKQFDDLQEKLTKHIGRNVTNLFDLFVVYESLSTKMSLGLSLPEWLNDMFLDQLHEAAILQLKLFSYNDDLIRKNGGKLLSRIITDMNNTIGSTANERKINLFSAHDLNVASFLSALNIFDNNPPSYTSGVLLELHKINGAYFVKVLHYLGIPSKFVEKAIPGCEVLCPYNQFISLTFGSVSKSEDPRCPTSD